MCLTGKGAVINVSAADLVIGFTADTAAANKKYPGKVLAVNGNIKTVEQESDTIVPGEAGSPSSVWCSMDMAFVKKLSTLNEGSNVTVKGFCTGYNADESGMGLSSDVVLNRCVLENNKQ